MYISSDTSIDMHKEKKTFRLSSLLFCFWLRLLLLVKASTKMGTERLYNRLLNSSVLIYPSQFISVLVLKRNVFELE